MAESPSAVVIMAGGAGTRFWPVSREARPKQFLALMGERTLLQQSYDRVAGAVGPERVLLLTNQRFVPLVREQLPELPEENIIGEPCRRDTAAAVALAAFVCEQRWGRDAVMAVLTADHVIRPVESFRQALGSAVSGARANPTALYTFALPPRSAATAYGYLRRGEKLPARGPLAHYAVREFREKPDAATAEHYLTSGEHYWNSGMFVWTVGAIVDEIERQLPGHARQLRPAAELDGEPGFGDALAEGFEPLEKTSIDYGVLEGARLVRCVEADFDWSDVGGWLALREYLAQDQAKNARRGHLHAREAQRNTVFCEQSGEHVVLIGVNELVVVRSGDRTLVMHESCAEQVKQLVQQLDEELR